MNSREEIWQRWFLPLALIVGGIAVAYAFNMFIGLALIAFAVGIGISRAIQRVEPPGPAG